MKFKFPEITDLKTVERAIHGRDEFIIAERDWGFVANYNVNFEDTFPETTSETSIVRRECRGIKFDKNGQIIGRPFHKFFNLGERKETAPENIDWSKHFIILDKLDGSMIHPILINNEIVWCTKMGPTDTSALVERFVTTNPQYNDYALHSIKNGITPIFEWCSRTQRIVVDYPEDMLVLTAARKIVTGEYISYDQIVKDGKQWNIPSVNYWNDSFNNIHDFMETVRERKDEEGYVIRFHDGHMLKIKNIWYLQLHKTKELMTFEKDVWNLILSEKMDDAKAFMTDEEKNRIESFAKDLIHNLDETADELKWIVIAAKDNLNDSKKRFAMEIVPQHKEFSKTLFSIWDGHDPKQVIYDTVMNSLGTASKLESVRQYAKNIRWADY